MDGLEIRQIGIIRHPDYEIAEDEVRLGDSPIRVKVIRGIGNPISINETAFQPEVIPALFRTFADTPTSEEGIVEFARRFGLLGERARQPRGTHSTSSQTQEPIHAWMETIKTMRELVNTWELIRTRDVDKLAERTEVFADSVFYEPIDLTIDEVPSAIRHFLNREFHDGKFWALTHVAQNAPKEAYAIPAASRFISRVLGYCLMGSAHPALEPSGDGAFDLYLQSHCLLGQLWLQLARAISENRDYRRCKHCNSWFELGGGTARADKGYCSPTCRYKAHWLRKSEARDLFSNGATPETIADKLGVHQKTLGKWLGLLNDE